MVSVIWLIGGWKWSNLRNLGGVNSKFANFTPLLAYSTNVFQQNSVQKCMTIMCIIVTEEDLCKKHVTTSALFCQYTFQSKIPTKV